MTTELTTTAITEERLAEIEHEYRYDDNPDSAVPSLVATVRFLTAEVKRLQEERNQLATCGADVWDERKALLNQNAELQRELEAARSQVKRVSTPSIVEALRLLDEAGYGKELPNSLSDMIRKAISR